MLHEILQWCEFLKHRRAHLTFYPMFQVNMNVSQEPRKQCHVIGLRKILITEKHDT